MPDGWHALEVDRVGAAVVSTGPVAHGSCPTHLPLCNLVLLAWLHPSGCLLWSSCLTSIEFENIGYVIP